MHWASDRSILEHLTLSEQIGILTMKVSALPSIWEGLREEVTGYM